MRQRCAACWTVPSPMNRRSARWHKTRCGQASSGGAAAGPWPPPEARRSLPWPRLPFLRSPGPWARHPPTLGRRARSAPGRRSAYSAALRADVQARKQSGTELLHSQQIAVSPAARGPLSRGQVDSRLLVTISGLASVQRVSVVGFGDVGPGVSPGVPLRSADLAATAGPGGTSRAARVQSMLAFLRAQRPPTRPRAPGRYGSPAARTCCGSSSRPPARSACSHDITDGRRRHKL
jgi:hypothetical protein